MSAKMLTILMYRLIWLFRLVEKKLDKLVIDASAAKDFERPFKSSQLHEPADQIPSISQPGSSRSPSDQTSNSTCNYDSEETKQQ
ncbi:unnamed protein product [Rhodiola kirilowii]